MLPGKPAAWDANNPWEQVAILAAVAAVAGAGVGAASALMPLSAAPERGTANSSLSPSE